MKHFYRIGYNNIGLWYDSKGRFTGNIHKNEYNWLKASNLRMPYDEYLVGYLSVADSLEHLYKWFSKEEIVRLQQYGFFIEEWVSNDYKFYDLYQHNVINKENSILLNKLLIQN